MYLLVLLAFKIMVQFFFSLDDLWYSNRLQKSLPNNKSKRVSPQILGIPPFNLITNIATGKIKCPASFLDS
jgi:hypothetical protein